MSKESQEGTPHRRIKDPKEAGVPKISLDYAYMSDDKNKKEEEKGMPIIIMKDKATGMKYARVVQKKGSDPYAVHVVKKIIEGLGYSKIILKSDQEPSIMALKLLVKNAMDIQIIKEESPAYDHQSNGDVENVVGQFRAKKTDWTRSTGVELQEIMLQYHG